jgi:hypothetical protein
MLQEGSLKDHNSAEENIQPNADANQGEQKLDGEEFNVINHEDVEDIDDDEEEGEHSFYRPGLAGLLGGRMMQRSRNTPGQFDHLHPFTQVLSISNVDDCVKLESEAFPPNERCKREKVIECAHIASFLPALLCRIWLDMVIGHNPVHVFYSISD